MKALAHARFWSHYRSLPEEVRRRADKQFALWLQNKQHPSLHFKKVGERLWSARVDHGFRALARERDGTFTWFWIGSHDDYERLIAQSS